MNKQLKITWLVAGLLVISSYGYCKSPKEKKITDDGNGKVVVELFTSEGCSSCPAADKVLEELADQYKGQVYVLGYHVDYWNHLGWKDVYSDKAYSDRQRRYAEVFKTESVYTPQAIVNGKVEMVGSNKTKLQNTINACLKEKSQNNIQLTATASGKSINIAYKASGVTDEVLNIALIQKHSITHVKNGENEGRTLSHINIVRDLKTVSAKQGNITLLLPPDISATACTVIAYTQQKNNMLISGATETAIK